MNECAKNLKRVNEEAAKVIRELYETNDKKVVEGLVYELANRVYEMGLKDGQKDSR
ncbi:hypothetical protein J2S00_003063 [Caldalkalibacillus uzonensis]|uniref:Uncharacterized protein n=1 Tax=Caldalkalibacillus uzonensis TaxID=353224 RepID=A0ABU0CV10_9BACI|nr:hypothetical protein [Caldalkalibacillus uzonensis]MDQ0340258.1 hypothetical protein [Caldalkalibacillus uzonensis]